MEQYRTLRQIQGDLSSGKISLVQLVEHYLQNIDERNERLNAFLEVYREEALQRAKELDEKRLAGGETGSLHGMVIGIKDNICYAGHNVTAASRILEGFESLFSATAVERLLEADAIIIGRLNCDEFAMGSSNENSAYGKVRNPIDENRVPGGSSGGSAVAVAADMCLTSLGSETGGSVRQPASFCNLVGLKPTYGRVSRHGLIAFASSFDQIGPFAHNTDDAAAVLQVISGEDEFDATVSTQPVPDFTNTKSKPWSALRIAYFENVLHHEGLDNDIKEAFQKALDSLKELGVQLNPIDFTLQDYIIPTYYVLSTAEASSNLSRYDGMRYGYRSPNAQEMDEVYRKSRTEGFGHEVKNRILTGTFVLSAGYYDAYYAKAQRVRRLLYNAVEDIYKENDFILTPTAPSVAFELGEKTDNPVQMYLSDILTALANLVGNPAVSLPLFEDDNGLPIGMQLMGPNFSEDQLLHVGGRWLQSVKPNL